MIFKSAFCLLVMLQLASASLDTTSASLNTTVLKHFLKSKNDKNQVKEVYCPEHDYKYYKCDDNYPYRSIDGSCNNLYVPWWGKGETPYSRILAPEYGDQINAPRSRGVNNNLLPNPRDVAMKVHSSRRTFAETTQFLTFFAQHVIHDLLLTARGTDNQTEEKKSCEKSSCEKRCDCGNQDKDCFNIPIPFDDIFNNDQKCLPFTRSEASNKIFDCKLSHREQLNTVTHWLDLSIIYGNTVATSMTLREFNNGLLKTSVNPANGEPDLPKSNLNSCEQFVDKCQFYMGGDVRMENHFFLSIFTRIFVREHNRIATELNKLDNGWNDEILFQEARRINIAQYQHAIHNEFLPILLGDSAMKRWDLIPTPLNTYFKGYDRFVNPQVKNCKCFLTLFSSV